MKQFVKKVFQEVGKDDISRRSAAFAYYTVFALAPFIMIFVAIGGFVVGEEYIQRQIISYFQQTFGYGSDLLFENIFDAVSDPATNTIFSVFGIAVFIFGTANLFSYLRKSLFEIFDLDLEKEHIVKATVRKHTFAFLYLTVLLSLIFILIFLNIGISLLVNFSAQYAGGVFTEDVLQVFNFIFSFLTSVLLFSLMYHLISRRAISWKSSIVGGIAASVLFLLVNAAFALYLTFSIALTFYGAASFVIAFLLWVYYVGHILFIGAEVAKVYNTSS